MMMMMMMMDAKKLVCLWDLEDPVLLLPRCPVSLPLKCGGGPKRLLQNLRNLPKQFPSCWMFQHIKKAKKKNGSPAPKTPKTSKIKNHVILKKKPQNKRPPDHPTPHDPSAHGAHGPHPTCTTLNRSQLQPPGKCNMPLVPLTSCARNFLRFGVSGETPHPRKKTNAPQKMHHKTRF